MNLTASFELAALAVAIEGGLGYPPRLFSMIGHPASWIGALLAVLDRRCNREDRPFAERRAFGALALGLLLGVCAGAAFLVEFIFARANLPSPLGLCLLALIASSLIAQQSLHSHVRAVALALEAQGLAAGRAAVGTIVGRNVGVLDEAGVCRAAIESLAENFSDGVVAPAFWLALAGLAGGLCYKAINTADSMIGHRTPRYAAFGFAAAKVDDLVNFVPARLSTIWILLAAAFFKAGDPAAAWRTIWRDARGHPSPNAGWPEAAFAGALGLRLGGPRFYGEQAVADGWIGSGVSTAAPRDIFRALALYRRACLVHWGVIALLAFALMLRV